MMAGLPGTGKSSLARALAERLPAAVLDKDRIRATLFEPGYVEYSREQDDFCLEIMLKTAGYLLAKDGGRHVIMDGRTFSRRYQRERVFQFCRTAGATWAILECVCCERTALDRLDYAMAEGTHPAANRTPELYERVRDLWEPIDEPKLVIDTDDAFEFGIQRALEYLRSGGRAG